MGKTNLINRGGKTWILGGGMTGLAAGMASGWPVFEACETPGGICSSYYVTPKGQKKETSPEDGEAYRFEIGGGHWIFGGDPAIIRLIRSITPVKEYSRSSAVFFPADNAFVPYPLQNNLSYLPEDIRLKALTEMLTSPKGQPRTMSDWINQSFGPTLTEKFFGPFHRLYTAGLWEQITPQDGYKSPIDAALVLRGASGNTPAVGYNTGYLYPQEGLGVLAQKLATKTKIEYCERAAFIWTRRKLSSAMVPVCATTPLSQLYPWTKRLKWRVSSWTTARTRARRCWCSTSEPGADLAARMNIGYTFLIRKPASTASVSTAMSIRVFCPLRLARAGTASVFTSSERMLPAKSHRVRRLRHISRQPWPNLQNGASSEKSKWLIPHGWKSLIRGHGRVRSGVTKLCNIWKNVTC